MTKLRAEFRQRRHHRAFRIAAAPDQPLLAELYEALQALPEPEDPLDADALATAATNLWKAQRKLGQEGGPTATYLARCRDGLAEIGLVIQDHDGDPYHAGRRLEVLAFEHDPQAAAEHVVHTVQPSVYLRDKHIQIGQVIVGTPDAGAEGGTDA
jgi:hypothetical protein